MEILPGIYYDSSLEWYEQSPELIQLALEVEQTPPVEYEMEFWEINPAYYRIRWALWEHTTELGTFSMLVEMTYLSGTNNPHDFLSKARHNKVTINKL